MRCAKKISLTGYVVQYIDLREPKPRTVHEENYTMDKDFFDAMGLLCLSIPDFIKARYARGGYSVISLVQIKPKRCVTVDLNQLWEQAGQETTTKETIGETENKPADDIQEG